MTRSGDEAWRSTRVGQLSHQDVERIFDGGYRDIEILPDGTLRETARGSNPVDGAVTRTLKTERT